MLIYPVCILIGSVLIIYSIYKLFRLIYPHYRHVFAGKNWPETTGTVLKSGIDSSSKRRGGRYHWARVRYSYQVLGVDHTGRLNIETLVGRKADAIQNFERFLPGTELQVRYNPKNPKECFTKFDRVSSYELVNMLWMPIGGVLLIIGGMAQL